MIEPENTASPGFLLTGSGSPVRAAWSTDTSSPSRRRASAGTKSPRRRRITSPGTISLAGGALHVPSRLTRAVMASWAFKASIALPACRSSQNPTTALAKSSSRMMKKSGQCRTTPDRTTATSITQGIGPQKYIRNFRRGLVFFSTISFGPYFVSLVAASAWVRPSGEEPRRFSTSAIGSVFRSSLAATGAACLAPCGLGWAALAFAMVAFLCSAAQRETAVDGRRFRPRRDHAATFRIGGTQMSTSAPGSTAFTDAAAALICSSCGARPCIFQFPAMRGRTAAPFEHSYSGCRFTILAGRIGKHSDGADGFNRSATPGAACAPVRGPA